MHAFGLGPPRGLLGMAAAAKRMHLSDAVQAVLDPCYTKCGSFQTHVGPELQCTQMISLPNEKTSASQVTHGIAPHAGRHALASDAKTGTGS